jgi:ParB/RepB/Spo0J family partition protein
MNPPNNETTHAPVGAQTTAPPQSIQNPDCPKCGHVIYLTQDTKPDGRIICDACKAKYKNLEALMKAVEAQRAAEVRQPAKLIAENIPVDLIDPNPHQPRQDFNQAKMEELAGSIKEHGVIQPIVVERNGDRYMLHAGERRWRASKMAGLTTVPAYIVPAGSSPQNLLVRAVVENVQRADMSPIELAKACQEMADMGLSDSEIAIKIGKSRSVVANTRRLLNLPQEQQDQVAKGELNERQALALLPLYALPAEVQGKVLNNWEGKKLANPKGLTSDQIRSSLNASVRSQGQEISLFEADQIFETAGNIHHPTCTGCDLYVKVGQQTICLSKPCLEAKQAQVMTTYLEQAGAATGLPYLDPAVELKYNQSDDFNGASEVPALEVALTNHCPNLRLEYRRRSWDYGEGPKDFDRCRYACFHNGEGCACAGQLAAAKEAEKKAKKEAIGQLKSEATNHVAKLITDNHPSLLRAILNTMLNNYYGGADLTGKMKPGQIVRKLAEQLVDRNAHINEYRSLEENRLDIAKWLDKVGLPPLLITAPNPVSDLDARLIRIGEWVKKLREAAPTPEQVRGNLANLAELANEAQQFQDAGSDQDRAQLTEKKILSSIDSFKSILLALQPIVESQADQVELEHVSWILTVPSGDGNFKDHLARINHVVTLDYIVALMPLFAQGKTAREAIERRRRKIEKEAPAPPTSKEEGQTQGDFNFARDDKGEAGDLQLARCWKCGDGRVRSYVRLPGQQCSGNICEKCGHIYVGMDFHHKRPIPVHPTTNDHGSAPRPIEMLGHWSCGRCKEVFLPGERREGFLVEGFDKAICAGCLVELQGEFAVVHAQIDLVTAKLGSEPAPTYLALKDYRTKLAELIRPLSQVDQESPELSQLLAQWEKLDDLLDERIKNFQHKPLKFISQTQEVAA